MRNSFIGEIYPRILLFARRSLSGVLTIVIICMFITFYVRLRRNRRVLKFITIIGIAAILGWSWITCFSWSTIKPLFMIYATDKYRIEPTRDQYNQLTFLELYAWYPIYSEKTSVNRDQAVINEYLEQGGSFNFNEYSYFMTYGFTMSALYENHFVANSNECIAVLGYDCEPDQVLIYQIPKTPIEPGGNEDRTSEWDYTQFYIYEGCI